MNKFIIPLIALVLFGNLYGYSQEFGSIEIQVKDWTGDLIDPADTKIIIYQDKDTIFKTVQLSTNPLTIEKIPQGHNYSFEIQRHGIHIDANKSILLNSNLEKTVLTIPPVGGIKFKIVYNDGYTQIPNAKIVIRSTDNAPIISTFTNNEGQTQRFWFQSTKPDEFYFAEISLGTGISYIYSPIKIASEISRDIKITTPWPSIIDNLITVSIYKEDKKITKDDGTFVVELYDKKNIKIDESDVNSRGEAFFSKIQVGEYRFKALKTSQDTSNDQTWGSTKIILTGKENQVTIGEGFEGLKISAVGCNCVAFRLDDVQDYSLNQPQMKVIDLFQEKNADLTIGVIGGLIGEDRTVVEFLKEKLRNQNSILEIASHSWNNSPVTSFSKEKQDSVIKSTNEQIKKIFGATPTVFIPPENVFNQDTLDVLKINNFTHLSSSFNYDYPPYPLTSSALFRFPQSTQTAIFDSDSNLWIIQERKTIIEDVISSVNNYGFSVVMMHPPDFSINDNGVYRNKISEKQIIELELLIDDLRNIGLKIVPISQINLDSTITPTISDKNSVNLVDEEIIQIPNCNCVAFSLDGIQDYWLNEVQLEILQTFEKTKTDLTVGIIGNHFGLDEKLVNYFKNLLKENEIEVDIANNGWDYEDFTQLTIEEQSSAVSKGNEQIKNTLSVKSKIFFPPLNKMNENTIFALKENGINYVSLSAFSVSVPDVFSNSSISYIPYRITTSKFDPSQNNFVGINQDESFLKIKQDIDIYGYSIIRLNPQEFSVTEDGVLQNKINSVHLEELESLIIKIKQNGHDIVLINKIPSLISNDLKIPEWIKNNALWWADNKISESEFVSGIEFLIKNKIILIPQIPESELNEIVTVPTWIKNNAEWWGNGLISDAEFVNGIEYLVKNSIIKI
jgi:peptidoglycan/xylan/chitin deacetylase (PgdA/CDA1 family)